MIGEDVQTALETGEKEGQSLSELQEVEGFEAIIENVSLPTITQDGTAREVANAALALGRITISNRSVERRAWKLLRDRINSEEDWYPATPEEGEGLVQILQHAPKSAKGPLAVHLLTMVSNVELKGDIGKRPNDESQWVRGVLPVIRSAINSSEASSSSAVPLKTVREKFHVPRSWPTYIEVLSVLSSEDDAEKLAPFFDPHSDDTPSNVDESMKVFVQDDHFDEDVLEGLKLMRFVSPLSDVSWTATIDGLYNKLSWNAGLDAEKLRVHLKAVLVLGAVFRESRVLDRFGNDQNGRANISHHLHEHRDDTYIAALCVLLRTMYSASQNRGANNGNAQTGHSYFTQILKNAWDSTHLSLIRKATDIVQEINATWYFLNLSVENSIAIKFCKSVVIEISERDNSSKCLKADVVCDFPAILHDSLSRDVFSEVVRQADEDSIVLENLKDLNKEVWFGYLKDETEHLNVVATLAEKEDFVLGTDYSDALYEHAEWMLESGNIPKRISGSWRKLLSALTEDARDALLGKIQTLLFERCNESVEPVLTVYGSMLSESEAAQETGLSDAQGAFRNRFPEILDRSNALELRWLAKALKNRPGLESEMSPASYWNGFAERVEEKGNESSGEVRKAFTQVADAVGVTIEPESGGGEKA